MIRIGEIIEAATSRFTAGTFVLDESPPFGSLVRAHTRDPQLEVYGIVYEVRTGSREPGGRAVVRGLRYSGEPLYDDEIYREHPDLHEVLQTEFSAAIVGFRRGEQVFHYLPPLPPPIHYSVYPCSDAELYAFGERFDFLRTLLLNPLLPGDELVAAALRAFAAANPNPEGYLGRVGRELAQILREDYDRLHAIVRRLR